VLLSLWAVDANADATTNLTEVGARVDVELNLGCSVTGVVGE
jgi:hypothetical protein